MKIKKFNNGNINLKLEFNYDVIDSLDKILNCNELFFNDLYFKIDSDGNLWMIDYNKQLAYDISIYPFYAETWKSVCFFKDLTNGKTVKLIPYGTIDKVKEFFNEDTL